MIKYMVGFVALACLIVLIWIDSTHESNQIEQITPSSRDSKEVEPEAIMSSPMPMMETATPKQNLDRNSNFDFLDESVCTNVNHIPEADLREHQLEKERSPEILWEADIQMLLLEERDILDKINSVSQSSTPGKQAYELFRLNNFCVKHPYNLETEEDLAELQAVLEPRFGEDQDDYYRALFDQVERRFRICQGRSFNHFETQSYLEAAVSQQYLPALAYVAFVEKRTRLPIFPATSREQALASIIENMPVNPSAFFLEKIAKLQMLLSNGDNEKLRDGLSIYELAKRRMPTVFIPSSDQGCEVLNGEIMQLPVAEMIGILEKSEEYNALWYD